MKRLKYFIAVLALVTSLLSTSFALTAEASSYSTGKAFIPTYSTMTTTQSFFYFSNITDDPINVTVTFYNSDGTILTDDNNAATGRIILRSGLSNYSEQNANSSVTFSLNAHCSGYFYLSSTPDIKLGYGEVQWSQSGSTTQGLIAWGQIINKSSDNSSEARSNIDINAGLPF